MVAVVDSSVLRRFRGQTLQDERMIAAVACNGNVVVVVVVIGDAVMVGDIVGEKYTVAVMANITVEADGGR